MFIYKEDINYFIGELNLWLKKCCISMMRIIFGVLVFVNCWWFLLFLSYLVYDNLKYKSLGGVYF